MGCPGAAAPGFDSEFCLRSWRLGVRVGLYDGGFTAAALASGGLDRPKPNNTILSRRLARNNRALYSMYRGFHHGQGNRRALAVSPEPVAQS
jgi:hypothetical protein